MKVAIIGATGFIGRRLCRLLSTRGIDVTALARHPVKAQQLLPDVPRIVGWNPQSGLVPVGALGEIDAVVNLAGEPIGPGRWTRERKRLIVDSRVLVTSQLIASLATLAIRPGVLVNASAAGYYGDRGDEILDEDSGSGLGFLAELCVAWEAEARRAEALGIRVVRLRSGLVFGRGGGVLEVLLTPFRLGLGAWFGDGRQWMPWIHIDDEAGLILHAIECADVLGALNATAPELITNREFARALGAALGRPTLFGLPAAVLQVALGEAATALLASQRVHPTQALATGYHFTYPKLRPALEATHL